jgi:CRP-like cAMP-binding protein
MKQTFLNFSLDLTARLERVGHRRVYAPEKEIFTEGDEAAFLPIVESGSVKMIRRTEPGKEMIIGTFDTGDLFAVPPVFDGAPYPATAVAITQTRLLQINRGDFLQILEERPEFSFAIISWTCEMLRDKTATIRNLATASPAARVGTVLVKLAEEHRGDFPIRIPARRQDIAEMANLTTETTIRVIRRFASRELLRIEHGKIFIDGLEPLRRSLQV